MHDQLGSGHDAAPTLWGESFCNLYRFRISLFKTSTSKLRFYQRVTGSICAHTVDILYVVSVMLAACTCEQCRCIAAHITLLRHQWKWWAFESVFVQQFCCTEHKSFKDVFCIVLAWISSGTWLWICMHKEHSTALGALAVTLDTLVVLAAAGSMVWHSAPGGEARLKYCMSRLYQAERIVSHHCHCLLQCRSIY